MLLTQKINKNAFTLLELIVATSILTISVFGIYRLIGENNKIANNNSTNIQANLLFPTIIECIEYTEIITNKYISFGDNLDGCITSDTKTPTNIDNIEYYFEAKNLQENKWEIIIESDNTGKLTQNYTQKK